MSRQKQNRSIAQNPLSFPPASQRYFERSFEISPHTFSPALSFTLERDTLFCLVCFPVGTDWWRWARWLGSVSSVLRQFLLLHTACPLSLWVHLGHSLSVSTERSTGNWITHHSFAPRSGEERAVGLDCPGFCSFSTVISFIYSAPLSVSLVIPSGLCNRYLALAGR